MSGALTKAIIAWRASSFSFMAEASSSKKVPKYCIRNLKDSFAELQIWMGVREECKNFKHSRKYKSFTLTPWFSS